MTPEEKKAAEQKVKKAAEYKAAEYKAAVKKEVEKELRAEFAAEEKARLESEAKAAEEAKAEAIKIVKDREASEAEKKAKNPGKMILRNMSGVPFETFRGNIRKIDGLDKAGRNTHSKANKYQFDGKCRMELTEEQAEVVLVDLAFFIKSGKIMVIDVSEIDDEIDVQDMTRERRISELARLGYKSFSGILVAEIPDEKLEVYLLEIYRKKLEKKVPGDK